jgi:hypothetical protein
VVIPQEVVERPAERDRMNKSQWCVIVAAYAHAIQEMGGVAIVSLFAGAVAPSGGCDDRERLRGPMVSKKLAALDLVYRRRSAEGRTVAAVVRLARDAPTNCLIVPRRGPRKGARYATARPPIRRAH